MRFSAEPAKGCGSRRVNWIGRQTNKRLRIIEASQNWVGTAPRDEISMAPPFSRNQVTFVGGLPPLLLPQKRRGRSEWKTRDLRRVRLSTSNLSQKMRNDKEHRREIAQK